MPPVSVNRLDEAAWREGRCREAFASMYMRYQPDLVAFCRRLTGNSDEAPAIAQEAFVRAWSTVDGFADGGPFWPWVSTIARRLCVDHLRHVTRDVRWQPRLALLDVSLPAPDEIVELREERAVLVAALRSLTPRERRLLLLRELDRLSYDQIAQSESMSIEAVRSALKRARIALRRAYSARGGLAGVLLRWRRGRTSPNAVSWMARMPWAEVAAAVAVMAAGIGRADRVVASPPPAEIALPSTTTAAAVPVTAPAAGASAGRASSTGELTDGRGAAPPVPASPWAGLPVLGEEAADPDETVFRDFDQAPDGTFFASGTTPCSTHLACDRLFRSTDGGRTWQQLPSVGYRYGDLLFPPSYPADSRIFLAEPGGLKVSRDGGATFEVAAPIGGPASISPAFDSGDPTILLGVAPGWSYNADTGVTSPADLPLPLMQGVLSVVHSPDFAQDRRLFAVVDRDVLTCTGRHCRVVARLDGDGVRRLVVSPGFAEDGTVWAWLSTLALRSTDGGETFDVVPLPAGRLVGVAFGAGGVYATVDDRAGRGRLFRSGDGGTTWERVALDAQVGRVFARGDTVVVAPWPHGVLWSSDRGRTWSRAT